MIDDRWLANLVLAKNIHTFIHQDLYDFLLSQIMHRTRTCRFQGWLVQPIIIAMNGHFQITHIFQFVHPKLKRKLWYTFTAVWELTSQFSPVILLRPRLDINHLTARGPGRGLHDQGPRKRTLKVMKIASNRGLWQIKSSVSMNFSVNVNRPIVV